MRSLLAIGLGLLGALPGQVLQNTGAPMRIEFQCTEEDMAGSSARAAPRPWAAIRRSSEFI